MHLVLVGLSHHLAPIEVRERLSCADHALPAALSAAAQCPGVRELAILSTCNRMEIYALVEEAEPAHAFATLQKHLSAFHQVPETVFAPYLYHKAEQEAIAHLLRVASGLDSLVLGEAQILGQVRTAMRAAQQAGTLHAVLIALFQQAIACGKRCQSETGLGRGAFSIGHAAVDLANSIFADLSHARVMILGAGKMSELTARHLVTSGVRFVVVANRTHDKAIRMAERLGGTAIHYDRFPEEMVTADIVISSTAAPHPIIHRETLQPILRKRRGKPLFLIDIAVPRDIDADVTDLDNVFLYNIDDLQAVVADEARSRAVEAQKAETIVSEEVASFQAWYRTRAAAPVITQMREHLEQIRQENLSLLRARLPHLSDRDWQAIETATRAMFNRVSREPILRLKRAMEMSPETSSSEAGLFDLASAAQELFGLTGDSPEPTATEFAHLPQIPTGSHVNPASAPNGLPDTTDAVASRSAVEELPASLRPTAAEIAEEVKK